MGPHQREFEVLLPIGYTDEAGRAHRRTVIRKMRGHEEALLYDPSLTAGQLVTELIRHSQRTGHFFQDVFDGP